MARVSRKKNTVSFVPQIEEKIFNTGIYARLSNEDNGVDSDSIGNQIYMLEKYVGERPYLKRCSVYSDNGMTGTNFERPGFTQLMDDIHAGRINCIVVKDLSRFGRNYIETGNYLEKVFPYLGVRFISVNDNYDSINPDIGSEGLMVSFKNLIHDVYAKDISKKISTGYEMMQKNGKFTGAFAPYGYSKSEEDHHKLIINEETAPVVREIFKLRLEGLGVTTIVHRLNDRNIPSPREYLRSNGMLQSKKYIVNSLWNNSTVTQILQEPVYLGHMAQRKSTSKLYKGEARKKHPVSEWVIVENTHEPIIDVETFNAIQDLVVDSKRKDAARLTKYRGEEKPENILKGLIVCGDCKAKMIRGSGTRNKNGKVYAYRFYCYKRFMKYGYCTTPSIREDFLLPSIYESIKAQIRVASDLQKIIEELVVSHGYQSRQGLWEQEMNSIQTKLKRLTSLKCSLYEDYIGKLLTESEYLFAKKKYEQDGQKWQDRLDELEREKAHSKETLSTENKWITAFRRFENEKQLTREMCIELIESVEVYGSRNISINYRYQDEYNKMLSCLNEQGWEVRKPCQALT